MQNNRRRGHNEERYVINLFKELTKFKDIVSSRYGSKMLDDKGVDILGLPFNVQIKTLNNKVKLTTKERYVSGK